MYYGMYMAKYGKYTCHLAIKSKIFKVGKTCSLMSTVVLINSKIFENFIFLFLILFSWYVLATIGLATCDQQMESGQAMVFDAQASLKNQKMALLVVLRGSFLGVVGTLLF